MKKILMIMLMLASWFSGVRAEVKEGYNAPTGLMAFYTDGGVTLWFVAPVNGGMVWSSDFSYDNGLSGLRQLEDGDAWANAGSGAEISTSAAVGAAFTNHASTLVLPVQTLMAGNVYELTYKSAGSRKTANQTLSVVLYKEDAPVVTIIEPYELSPSLTYEDKAASFTVESDGEYEVRFVFGESEKTCGASLMSIVLVSPVPQGRGELTGYNLYRNSELVRTYAASEAVRNNLYMELRDETAVDYSTTYVYELQAQYEGGESVLSDAASLTTPDDPMAGVEIVPVTPNAAKVGYDILGRKSAGRGLKVTKERKTMWR